MVMVRLLISDGSWLVLRMAEKATRPAPDLTDMPRAIPDGSAEGVESHTTRHFPSNTIGSVSFCPLTLRGPHWRKRISPRNRVGLKAGKVEWEECGWDIFPIDGGVVFVGFVGILSFNAATRSKRLAARNPHR